MTFTRTAPASICAAVAITAAIAPHCMRRWAHAVAASAALAVLATSAALAQPNLGQPAATGTAPTVQAMPNAGREPAKTQERMARRVDALKNKLQITPAQEGIWSTYVAAMKPLPRKSQLLSREQQAQLSTPERIDRMRVANAERAAQADQRGAATKILYAALTPSQQKILDAEVAEHMARRHNHH